MDEEIPVDKPKPDVNPFNEYLRKHDPAFKDATDEEIDAYFRRQHEIDLKKDLRRQNIMEYVVAPIMAIFGSVLGALIGIALIKLVLS